MVGLSKESFDKLKPEEQSALRQRATRELSDAGAHYVIDSVADIDSVLDAINAILGSSPAVDTR